ncbi:MAG: hypothetical protein GQ582_00855 [Methyloprofundus sp.]|nr:hypothetical protein [Methyloprofundus sp.]
MKSKSPKILPVCLYGMDGRTLKTMLMFLQGPCRGMAQVVDEEEGLVDIIDADATHAKDNLDHCLARQSVRPIILLSLEHIKIEHTLYVKKPINAESMVTALQEAVQLLSNKNKKVEPELEKPEPTPEPVQPEVIRKPKKEKHKVEVLSTEKKVYTNDLEQKKIHKHEAATLIDEQHFSAYIGTVSGIDFNDPEQWQAASYEPRQYYQGYVQSSIKAAFDKGQVLKLESGWKPLIILPHSYEIWLAVDEKQLRAFAGVAINLGPSTMSLAPVNPKVDVFANDLEHFQEVNAFLWKLACWTSKGRYPAAFDLSSPVYLRQWPNFTRLMITPHAMRIAAVLVAGPKPITDIIEGLKIQPQYVFIFISAAHATGILGLAQRQADKIVETSVSSVSTVKKKSLFGRILNKLRS